MSDEHLFAYGTLLDPNVQQEVLGRIIEGTPDVLAGYQRLKVEVAINGSSGFYYTIFPNHTHTLSGLMLLITPEELATIDAYETDLYTRERHTLQSGNNAWVYIAKP